MMSKKIFLLVLILILGLVGSTQHTFAKTHASLEQAAKASSAKGIEGEWNGTLEAGGQKFRLVLKISKGSGDKLTGTIDSLDQGANDIPISSVEQKADQVKLELSSIGASYEGKMNADGSEISGEWHQGGGSFPLVFRRPGGKDSEDKKKPKGLPASLAGFEDQGTFFLMVNEERLGVMQHTWKSNGQFESHTTISLAGQSVQATTKIVPDVEGRWTQITMEAPTGAVNITRDGSSVKRTIKEKTTDWETREGVLLFENNSPALMSQALRQYDRTKGGVQTFPLLILPGAGVDLKLEMKESAERSVGGKNLSLTKFIYGIPGADITVWADASGKLYMGEVQAQKAAFVREGFEELRKAEANDPTVSAPKYEVVVDRGVGVPMRDSIKLSTDIYRPQGVEKAPVILVRTPYKKEMNEQQAKFYARRGYVYAVQDCRGRFGSPGEWEPFINESKDGYDAVEWLAQQPFSNGKVGMIGGSYLGWVQWWAAAQHPPHLVTMIPNVAPPDPFYNIPYEYGAFALWPAIWWADIVDSQATADLSGVTISKIFEKKYNTLLRALPVIDLDKTVLGKENLYWRKWIQHSTNDDYWKPADFLDHLKDVNIPVFHQSGWFDG
ncbi:MAG TPA: CocE/NonD family hydrolase, partial [Candidatus Angelobacter sp.]|nr:CocE/NonD family hydrolase [Candidatus Angelobacter sp.]